MTPTEERPPTGDVRRWPQLVLAIALRTIARLFERDVSLIAAGMSFYMLLALFPGVVVLAAAIGLLASPEAVAAQLEGLAAVIPEGARAMIAAQVRALAARPHAAMSLESALALLIALWGATRGLKGLIAGLNVLQGHRTVRGFLHFNVFTIALTSGAFALGFALSFLSAVVPPLFAEIGIDLHRLFENPVGRWSAPALAIWVTLVLLYRFGMSLARTPWIFCALGAALGLTLWLAGTMVFSGYVRLVTFYSEIYGPLTTVVFFLLWLFVSTYAVLIGGALVAELMQTFAPRRTRRLAERGPKESALGKG